MPNPPDSLYETRLKSLPLIRKGKVRDIYDLDEEHLLIVATDRISAFDVIMPTPIPGKGAVLTAVSNFWFGETRNIVANHLSAKRLEEVIRDERDLVQVAGRAVVARKLRPLPVEAIVRGYLTGSGWKDYQASGKVCGIALPAGLEQAARLDQALFTPSTKAEAGAHDENIGFDRAVELLGGDVAEQVRRISLDLYHHARKHAEERGILIADTKFEFGLDADGQVILIDEALTPDSSRFWPAEQYRTGISPPSFDKQFLRDYLETLDWDKTAPGPELPDSIVARTAAKYREAQERLTRRISRR